MDHVRKTTRQHTIPFIQTLHHLSHGDNSAEIYPSFCQLQIFKKTLTLTLAKTLKVQNRRKKLRNMSILMLKYENTEGTESEKYESSMMLREW